MDHSYTIGIAAFLQQVLFRRLFRHGKLKLLSSSCELQRKTNNYQSINENNISRSGLQTILKKSKD